MRRSNHLLWMLPLLLLLAGIGAYNYGGEWLKALRHGVGDKLTGAPRPDLIGHVHAQDGSPVQATVLIYSAAPPKGPSVLSPYYYPDCRKSAQVNDQGDFKIKALDPELLFRVLVTAKGYEPKFVAKVNPSKKPIDVELKLSTADQAGPARTLRGRVVDAKGDPVETAVVTPNGITHKGQGESWGQYSGVDTQAVTDDHGEFLLTAKEPFEALGVKVEAHGYASKIFSSLASGGQSHSLTLTEGVKLTGRVTQKGKPLAGVVVGLISADRNMESFTGNSEVATDAEGRFTFMNVAPNTDYHVYGLMNSLKKYGALPVTMLRSGNDGTNTKAGDLAVVPGFRIAGKVILSDGKPLSGKTKLQVGTKDGWDNLPVTVDPDGSFAAAGIPGGGVSMSLRINGYFVSKRNKSLDQLNPYRLVGHVDHDISGLELLLEKGKETPPDYSGYSENRQPFNLPLHGAEGGVDHSHEWKVTGLVTDGETQQPLEHFQVIPGDLSRNAWQNPWEANNLIAGTNGQYTIYFDKRVGQPALQVKAEGYLPVKVSLLPLEQTNANASLKKGSGPSGAVRTADGKVVAGASVLLICVNDQNLNLNASGEFSAYGRKDRIMKTDDAGRFTFAPELDMEHLVASSSNGFGFVTAEGLKSNANIILQPLGSIKGSLKRTSGPGTNEDLDIAFTGDNGTAWPRLRLNKESQTDGAGNFEFDRVPPGRLEISYRKYMDERGRHSGWQNVGLLNVTVLPGANITTNIQTADRPKADETTTRQWSANRPPPPKANGEIKAKVFLPDGKPASEAQVALLVPNMYLALGKATLNDGGNQSQQIVTSNPKGEFTLPTYENATTVLAVNEDGFAQSTVDELKATPKLTLQPWGRIEGTLHIGHHLGINQVVILSAGGFGSDPINFDYNAFQARTDDQGHFVMTFVPPGDRQIARLVPMGNGSQMHQPVGSIVVKAGGVTTADVGGNGQTVIGRVKLPGTNSTVNWKIVQGTIHTTQPKPDIKMESLKTPEEIMAYQNTPGFKAKMRIAYKDFHSYPVKFANGEAFTAEEVPPGNYEFDVQQFDRASTMNPFQRLGHGEITVPKSDATNDAPVDLGVLELKTPEPLPSRPALKGTNVISAK